MDFESVKTFEKRSDESLKHSNLRMNQLSVDSDLRSILLMRV
jgi:hypothetical protein